MELEGAKPYPAMDRIKSLSKSWRSHLNLSADTDKLKKIFGRSPNSADHNPTNTGMIIVGTDDTGIHNAFSNMNVQDTSEQAPIHAGKAFEPSEAGATSMERQALI